MSAETDRKQGFIKGADLLSRIGWKNGKAQFW
jgi:hypothetical protein